MIQRRTLGWFDITCLGLNCVIGSGIFLTPGSIAAQLGPYAPLAFVAGALLCLTVGLCFAEMAHRYPGTGGAYLYSREAFGPKVGFTVGWVMWLSGLIGGASVAVALGDLLGKEPGTRLAIAVGTVLTLGAINFLGARGGAWTNDLLALLKLGPLLALVAWGLWHVPLPQLIWPAAVSAGPVQWGGFLLILYTFSGFEEIALPAGEVRDAGRNVPVAIMLTLVIVTGVYVVIQGTVSGLGLAGAEQPLLQVAGGTPWLQRALTVGGLASLASINAAIAFTCPRSLWALAADGRLPAALRVLHPRFGSPWRCVLICSALTLVLIGLVQTFTHLVRLSVLASLLQFIATVLAVLKLRTRLPLLVPVAGLLTCLLLLFTSESLDLAGIAVSLAVGAAIAQLPAREN